MPAQALRVTEQNRTEIYMLYKIAVLAACCVGLQSFAEQKMQCGLTCMLKCTMRWAASVSTRFWG